MDKQVLDALTKVRNYIHESAAEDKTPTVVNMARNATLFLDTAYMWMSTMEQVMAERAGAEGTAVTQGNFTPPAQG